MEKNQLISALSQVPELVEQTKTLHGDVVILAEGLKNRVQAEIPEDEIHKASERIAARVSNTKCALPDTEMISRDIAGQVASAVHSSVTEAVKEAIDETPVRHEHYHTTGLELMKHADETMRRRMCLALAALAAACIMGFIVLYSHFNSEEHLGKEYAEICFSRYATAAEKEALTEDCYSVAFLPKDLSSNKALLKQRIKQNRKIIKQRKQEAGADDGKFSIETTLER